MFLTQSRAICQNIKVTFTHIVRPGELKIIINLVFVNSVLAKVLSRWRFCVSTLALGMNHNKKDADQNKQLKDAITIELKETAELGNNYVTFTST